MIFDIKGILKIEALNPAINIPAEEYNAPTAEPTNLLSNIKDPNTKKRLMENTLIIPAHPPEAPKVLTKEEAIN